jgi:cysteine dioxygenase
VLFADEVLEGMVAQWTPGTPCAPHDHGGSHGAVRVISGEALHTVWAVEEGELVAMETTRHGVGDVLPAPQSMIHSMQDAGGDAPLITLHLYTDAIEHMTVYDQVSGRTCIVDGSCGAWIPVHPEEGLLAQHDGILAPSQVPLPLQD